MLIFVRFHCNQSLWWVSPFLQVSYKKCVLHASHRFPIPLISLTNQFKLHLTCLNMLDHIWIINEARSFDSSRRSCTRSVLDMHMCPCATHLTFLLHGPDSQPWLTSGLPSIWTLCDSWIFILGSANWDCMACLNYCYTTIHNVAVTPLRCNSSEYSSNFQTVYSITQLCSLITSS